ncbi:arginyl-tRNA-protein transferase [mine drainage metagenome]|uniref:Arginyl-tRNA-protein transferase n=1 Tax=mine drainage metagenome TaxID=410659 RepID=T0XUL6_9ZZZZ
MQTERVRLFQTLPQACGYWHGRTAVNLVLDPSLEGLAALYPQALAHGFRRAGPHCIGPIARAAPLAWPAASRWTRSVPIAASAAA